MKKLSIFCGIALVLGLMSGPAYAQSFGFDVNGDGVIDEPAEVTIFTSETVQVDVYLLWPTTNPNVGAIDWRFSWDPLVSVQSIDHNRKPDGPWNVGSILKTGLIYYDIGYAEFGLGVPGPQIILASVVLHCEGLGDTTLTATLDSRVVVDVDGNEYTGVDYAHVTIHQLGCAGDEDCDDGLFCNGEEICVDGACQQVTDPCPGETCDEDTNSCESTPATTTTRTSPDVSMTTIPINGTPSTPDSAESKTTTTVTTAFSLTTTTTKPTTKKIESPERIMKPSPKTTTIPHSTTTLFSSPYRVIISPSPVTLNSGGVVQFSAKTISDGNEVKGSHIWEIVPASSIGSTIDDNGLFVAGNNTSGSTIKETIQATDLLHENNYLTVTVTINVKKQPPVGCELSISPLSATVLPGDNVTFFAKIFGERCGEDSYKWKVLSKIDSQISVNGKYTAGKNTSGKSAFDIIILEDTTNNISIDAMITVLSKEKGAQVAPDTTQKPQQETLSGSGSYLKILIIIVVLIILTGIVLFWKIRR